MGLSTVCGGCLYSHIQPHKPLDDVRVPLGDGRVVSHQLHTLSRLNLGHGQLPGDRLEALHVNQLHMLPLLGTSIGHQPALLELHAVETYFYIKLVPVLDFCLKCAKDKIENMVLELNIGHLLKRINQRLVETS